MKISARNIIPGKVLSVKKGPISSLVTLQIAPGVKITASITSESVKELKLAKGKAASAIIKSSSIMLGVDD